jgi:hypothetical protein
MRDDDGDLALLGELLDRSFGAGPEGLPTPVERLAVGRRALRRRRRLTVAGTSVAVVIAIGAGVALSGGGDHGANGPPPPIATHGTPSVDASAQAEARALAEQQRKAHRADQRLVSAQFPASYAPDGRIVVKDRWGILQIVEEPMRYLRPERSVGLIVSNGEQTRWMLLTLEKQVDGDGNPTGGLGPTAAADDPGKGYARFEDWLDSMVALNGGPKVQPLLTVDDADELHAGRGAELVATRPIPVIDGYTTAGDRMAEVRRDGRTWFVVVRGHGPDADVIPADAGVLSAPTFSAFVDHVRSQAASGEGLR